MSMGAVNLANPIRAYGHLAAQLDPLRGQPRGDPSLELATHGLAEAELCALPASLIGGPVAKQAETAWGASEQLNEIYSSTTGYSYEHIHDPQERKWLRDASDSRSFCPNVENLDAVALLHRRRAR